MAITHEPPLAQAPKGNKSIGLAKQQRRWGLIFVAPWIIGFLGFTLFPMIASLAFSFTDYHLTESKGIGNFVGLDNWFKMFRDPDVHKSLSVTIRFILISVPLFMALPLAFAVLLNSKHLLGKRLARTLFYLPVMVPGVAGTAIWSGMFNPQTGWFGAVFRFFGSESPNWLNDAKWVLPALAIMGVWGVGNTMLIMLAGLQGVPTELYEAARIDGAGPLRSFWHITIPMISPVLFYNLVLGTIGGFQYFMTTFIIYNGQAGPEQEAYFFMLKLFKEGWNYLEMGYASTLAWGLFIIALVITGVLFGTAKKWVYYAGGEA
jgi:multiple sugar transport system permease protein